MKILCTGGTGYIGSHTAVCLIEAGHEVILADNLSNSEAAVVDYIEQITGVRPPFYEGDVCDKAFVDKIFCENAIDGVVHFAGYKAVGESVAKPLAYYRNNMDSMLTVLEVMEKHDCKVLVFSSSATVYGGSAKPPYDETMETGPCTNPYGWTKYMIEQVLRDAAKANPNLSVILLRYFNPVGAHESALLGENPKGIPNNLMPYISQVATGIREKLSIFGNDYKTPDGTGVRDYIHVMDLAKGHVKAVDYARGRFGCEVFNLGTGQGYSVLDMVKNFEEANGLAIPYEITSRRPGDVDSSFANAKKAEELLHWTAEKSLLDMCKDSFAFQNKKR